MQNPQVIAGGIRYTDKVRFAIMAAFVNLRWLQEDRNRGLCYLARCTVENETDKLLADFFAA